MSQQGYVQLTTEELSLIDGGSLKAYIASSIIGAAVKLFSGGHSGSEV